MSDGKGGACSTQGHGAIYIRTFNPEPQVKYHFQNLETDERIFLINC